ncbi:TonB-dependent receptor plug domain-containing protein [Methylosinus sp. H3A]|uniref:TonB-dependent receptor plug domain-containing protein n=1 Tax=Methylosinus sp. H3A TaxID=2785786 RepID=UPI0018C33862|nr:Plug domain-containing protein [Methylosinus sp. H3A]MBG0809443.1 TonB-dependent receptor plug domain-containing protein [Methylosinus sp. H3A]
MPHVRILAGVALALISTGALAASSQKAKRASAPPSEEGYYVPFVTTPGGEKRHVMDVPGSVTVVSRKFMDDIQATTVGDALRFVPGVQVIGR